MAYQIGAGTQQPRRDSHQYSSTLPCTATIATLI